jgi:uncharacterized integral membrane protein
MWWLIELLIVLLVELVFILLNQNARCDISLGFWKFDDAPVYIISIVAFLIGAASAIPFFIASHFKRKKKDKNEKRKKEAELPVTTGADFNGAE